MKPRLDESRDVSVALLHRLAAQAHELQFAALVSPAGEGRGRKAEHVGGVLRSEQGAVLLFNSDALQQGRFRRIPERAEDALRKRRLVNRVDLADGDWRPEIADIEACRHAWRDIDQKHLADQARRRLNHVHRDDRVKGPARHTAVSGCHGAASTGSKITSRVRITRTGMPARMRMVGRT